MFEISVTREFENWYQALDAETAEKIAAELNVLERLGPELDTARSSPLLLWFDGVQNRVPVTHWGLRQSGLALGRLLQRQHEALRCLETPNFLARFLQLEAWQAQRGHELLERLRARVGAASLRRALSHTGGLRALELADGATLSPQEHDVQEALLDVLSFVGLRLEDVADRASGLRELTIAELSPPQRLLYAIDAPRNRILAILGEALDRAYYGDSVRLAERHWREYCSTLQVSGAAI